MFLSICDGGRFVAGGRDAVGSGLVDRDALSLVRELPVQRLARPGAVIHHAAHRAAPELMAARLRPAAAAVGAESQTLRQRGRS